MRMQLETTFCPDIYSCYLIIVTLGSNFKPFDYSIDRYTSVVHTRIRLDACALNYHLRRIGIKQSPACSCGFVNESKSHYFLNCPNYAAQRQTLLTCAACIAPNLWSRLSDKPKTELFYIWFIFTQRRTKKNVITTTTLTIIISTRMIILLIIISSNNNDRDLWSTTTTTATFYSPHFSHVCQLQKEG